jgi:hypothetical protein
MRQTIGYAATYGTVAVFTDLYGNLWDLLQPR